MLSRMKPEALAATVRSATLRCLAAPALLAYLTAASPTIASSQTDRTDPASSPPITAMGLLPVEALGSLSLVHESFIVTPRQDGCEVRREVSVRCRGGTGTYRVAIDLRAPDGTAGGLDSTIAMALDGVPRDLLIYDDGYEAGPGTWAEMELPISRNTTRTIEISYQFRGDALASAEFARAQLGIHAQTLWANNVVPRIEARLALRGSGFTVADFEPRDAVSGPCVLDLQREGQTLVWKVRSYRRSTWNRSTTDWLVRPPGAPPAGAAEPNPPTTATESNG
jgi:hypothetical protein